MSSQVNFYLSPADQAALVRLWSEVEGAVAVSSPTITSIPEVKKVTDFDVWKAGLSVPYIFHLSQLKDLKYRWFEPRKSYYLEYDESPAIEFSQCIFRKEENLIQRGRLYYKSRYVNSDGHIEEKSAEFLKFARRLFSITKKFCGKPRVLGYVGPEAELFASQGVKLSDGNWR